MVTVLQQRRWQLLLLSSLPRVLQPAMISAWAPDPKIVTRAVINKYKNTIASPAYNSETTVPQRGQPRNQGTNPTNLHALPYSGSLLSELACSLTSPRKIPSACYQLLQLLSDLHISLQLSPVLVWNCCLAFWAVFPVACEPACREDLKSSHSKEQWGIRKGRQGETAVHSPE